MATRRLPETAFKATFSAPMREITGGEHDAIDIWPYVDAIPAEELDGLRLRREDVSHVWRDTADRYDHVLLPLDRRNTYLVIVVDLRGRAVYGHHVLDLGALYGSPADESAGGVV